VKVLRHPALHWAAALVLGGVFLYASWEKIALPQDFARIVYRYQVVGPSGTLGFRPANVVAVVLPWLEAIVGVCLVTGWWRKEAAAIAGALLAVFVAAVASTLARGIDIANCGCFSVGGAGRGAGWGLIAGDLALLALAALLVFVEPRRAADPVAASEPATAH
jgi:cobalt-zinc-cadmium efflux system protein